VPDKLERPPPKRGEPRERGMMKFVETGSILGVENGKERGQEGQGKKADCSLKKPIRVKIRRTDQGNLE